MHFFSFSQESSKNDEIWTFAEIKRVELVMSLDRVELWWAMILNANPHFKLKKSSSQNRLLKNYYFLKFTENFGKKRTFSAKNVTFLAKNQSIHLPKKRTWF